MENTTASSSTTSTVPTASYTTSVISPLTATTTSATAAVTKNRPRVNLQKAAEYSAQVQGKYKHAFIIFLLQFFTFAQDFDLTFNKVVKRWPH